MRDLIKHIVFEEFSKLTTLIEKDFCSATRFLRNSDRIIEKK